MVLRMLALDADLEEVKGIAAMVGAMTELPFGLPRWPVNGFLVLTFQH